MAFATVFLTVLRMFQFVSYLYTAFAFIKYNVLPTMRLTADVTKTWFSSRHPTVNLPGRTDENRFHSKLITLVEGVGPFHPRYRRDDVV
jgi:hypothetical protein